MAALKYGNYLNLVCRIQFALSPYSQPPKRISPGQLILSATKGCTMTTLRFLQDHSVKARWIKLAVDTTCEVCGREEWTESLEIHSFLEGREDPYCPSELEAFILILCSRCHGEIHYHAISRSEQEELVRMRPNPVREKIQSILAHVSRPYIPPEVDLESAYREASAPHTRY